MTPSKRESSAACATFLCPSCSGQVEAYGSTTQCPHCNATIDLRDDVELSEPLRACALCGSEALYIAKDFNKNLGVLIVALGCVGFFWGAAVGIATLVVLTILDRIVYYLRPLVTVCYACKAVYRGAPINPTHKPYELTFDETFEGTGDAVRFTPAGGAEPSSSV